MDIEVWVSQRRPEQRWSPPQGHTKVRLMLRTKPVRDLLHHLQIWHILASQIQKDSRAAISHDNHVVCRVTIHIRDKREDKPFQAKEPPGGITHVATDTHNLFKVAEDCRRVAVHPLFCCTQNKLESSGRCPVRCLHRHTVKTATRAILIECLF